MCEGRVVREEKTDMMQRERKMQIVLLKRQDKEKIDKHGDVETRKHKGDEDCKIGKQNKK